MPQDTLHASGTDRVSAPSHRNWRIMGCGLLEEDREGLTMPEIYSYPCSPHLAAEIDGREIDFDKIERATAELSNRFDAVLLEGAGGLMVPLTRELLTIDYIAAKGYPLIYVTSGRLGSINHFLLGLEAIRRRGIRLHTVAYNLFPREDDDRISRDTEGYIRNVLSHEWPGTRFLTIPYIQ